MRDPRPLPAHAGRRLAVLAAGALLTLGGAVGAGASPAAASGTEPTTSPSASPSDTPSDPPGTDPSADGPTDVFIGVVDRVTSSREPDGATGGGRDVVTYDVTVLSVYLGEIRTESVEVVTTPSVALCTSRRVVPDTQYAFTVVDEDDALQASACSDIRTATAGVRRGLARDYPGVRPPVAAEATFEDVAYTSSDTGEPIAFTRAAAPGLALVIVGLLGLLVTRRITSR